MLVKHPDSAPGNRMNLVLQPWQLLFVVFNQCSWRSFLIWLINEGSVAKLPRKAERRPVRHSNLLDNDTEHMVR